MLDHVAHRLRGGKPTNVDGIICRDDRYILNATDGDMSVIAYDEGIGNTAQRYRTLAKVSPCIPGCTFSNRVPTPQIGTPEVYGHNRGLLSFFKDSIVDRDVGRLSKCVFVEP